MGGVMRARTIAWTAWCAWAILAGLAILLQALTTGGFPTAWGILPLGGFMTVGAVVVSRQPRNTVGWLCCVAGLLGTLGGFAEEYAGYVLGPLHGSLPGGLVMAWLTLWVGALWVGLTFTLLLLLFPTGRLPSRRWRPVAWASVAGVAGSCAVLAVMPGPMIEVPSQPRNPLGIEPAAVTLDRIEALLNVCLALLVLLCAASVVVRFRRAGGVERHQLKWFAYGAGQLALLLGSGLGLSGLWERVPQGVSDLVFAVSFTVIPVAIGIAILRYRLYDIDRLIRRTLVYGLLTALLGAVYAGLVLGLGQLSGRVGAESPSWVVAGATLAVAALFQPARRRIQHAVDRRFNRRRYDAAKTIEAFSTRLREQLDLDTLSAELLAVVDQTMQPTRASLWLRPPTSTSQDHGDTVAHRPAARLIGPSRSGS
jgi:hypothetical protein